ncbi:hypothetical protein FGG08_003175 [Glutinoglossum americanum]|uniref:Major facilitator superfamily (MFS) profile domain-containing protein n=1 Tax=Glutinoglossum americanum TaxID=1670608 RepID=A0A9P8L3V9_9PEZI|nr:hypothetical protein FGG08_003175 [Glutinoglossum americanum]
MKLSAGTFLLFFGKVADSFGRRTLLIASITGFTLSAFAIGFAKTPIYMDVLQGILGLFSAAAVPPAVGALGAAYSHPSERKNRAFACFSAGNPLGFILGAVMSGIAARLASWRASFWALAVIYGAITVVAYYAMPVERGGLEKVGWVALRRFDVVGTVLAVLGIAMFSVALTLGGDAINGWGTSYVIILLILGIASMVGFIAWEGVIAGLILHRVSNKLLTAVGALCYVIAFALLALQRETTSYWAMTFPALILSVFGADLHFNVANMYVMSSLPTSQQSLAGGIFNTATRLCMTLGLGITTAIFSHSAQRDRSVQSNQSITPYQMVFWSAAAMAGASILLLPWLTIGVQGGKSAVALTREKTDRSAATATSVVTLAVNSDATEREGSGVSLEPLALASSAATEVGIRNGGDEISLIPMTRGFSVQDGDGSKSEEVLNSSPFSSPPSLDGADSAAVVGAGMISDIKKSKFEEGLGVSESLSYMIAGSGKMEDEEDAQLGSPSAVGGGEGPCADAITAIARLRSLGGEEPRPLRWSLP